MPTQNFRFLITINSLIGLAQRAENSAILYLQ